MGEEDAAEGKGRGHHAVGGGNTMEATGLERRHTWRRGGWIHRGEGRRLAQASSSHGMGGAVAMEWGERARLQRQRRSELIAAMR